MEEGGDCGGESRGGREEIEGNEGVVVGVLYLGGEVGRGCD